MVAKRWEMVDVAPALEVGDEWTSRDTNQVVVGLVSEMRPGGRQAWSARFMMRAPGALRHVEGTIRRDEIQVNISILFRGPG